MSEIEPDKNGESERDAAPTDPEFNSTLPIIEASSKDITGYAMIDGMTPVMANGQLVDAEREIRRLSRRSFLWAGVTLATGFGAWKWINTRPQVDGIGMPFRRVLEFNEKLTRSYFSPSRLAATFPVSLAREPVVTGEIGMTDPSFDTNDWRLIVEGMQGSNEPISLTMADIKALPKFEMVTEHKCVEGWSRVVHWAGARFADFAAKYPPAAIRGAVPGYVSMRTSDETYYVGLDMPSAIHPQTLLCYEMNGEPLTAEHGAPLRLAIPLKYGIKCIKWIGTIRYADTKPADYWAERGYDWYAGF